MARFYRKVATRLHRSCKKLSRLPDRKREAQNLTSLSLALRVCGWEELPYLYVAGFDRYLREIISTNKLASTWLDDVIEENFANRVVVGARFTVVENGKEGGVKFIVENRISCFPDCAAEAGSVSYNLKTGDVELGTILRVKRWVVKYRTPRNGTI